MSLSEHSAAQVGQMAGQTERKLSPIDLAFEVMANEVAAIHAVVGQLHEKLEPVRLQQEEADEQPGSDPCPPRSPVVTRLNELADALSGQRERLEHLSEEIQL